MQQRPICTLDVADIGIWLHSVCIWLVLGLLSIGTVAAEAPRQLNSALELPAWLSISGQHRTRYETVDEQFRAGRNGDDQILVFRTNILTEIMLQNWTLALEVLDARQAHAKDDTPVNTGIVNPLDVLQLFAQWRVNHLIRENSISSFKVGRFTLDVGSRRLVARTLFRNTFNAFTGFDWQWQSTSGARLRTFYTFPVDRLPRERRRLIDNRSQGDDQDTEVKFWGLYYGFSNKIFPGSRTKAEIYYFGLNENDSHNRPTRNRDLHTVGGRWFTRPQMKQFDFELETAIQFGSSRSSAEETNKEDLDHFAQFHRVELGYQYDANWSPRLSMQLDFASGDDDPDDDDNNRFDSLFGARRFDFGPVGIYGPFARANLISPGIRLQIKPSAHTSAFLAHRGYWLASNKDAWVVAGVQDSEGDSGSYIGQQLEIRVRWEMVPQTLRFEAGGAYLFKGSFADNAPNANGEGDANYFYSQLLFTF